MHQIINHGAFGENQCLRNTLTDKKAFYKIYQYTGLHLGQGGNLSLYMIPYFKLKIVHFPYIREQSLAKD